MQGPAPSEASLTFSGTQFLHSYNTPSALVSSSASLLSCCQDGFLKALSEVQTPHGRRKVASFCVLFVRNLYQHYPSRLLLTPQRSHWVIYPHLNYTLRREMRLPLTHLTPSRYLRKQTPELWFWQWNILCIEIKARLCQHGKRGTVDQTASWCYRPAGLSRSYSCSSFCTHIWSLSR